MELSRLKNKAGVYCIESMINGKKYIGQTLYLKNRKSCHFSKLMANRHVNKH